MKEHNRAKGEESFMKRHLEEAHRGREGNFEVRVTKTNKHCLSRQIREGVQISLKSQKRPILNSKSEWHQPSLYSIKSEIVR